MNINYEDRKKQNKSIILGILIIIIVILATVGCIFYNLLKPDDFKKEWGALGYTVEKGTENYLKDYKVNTYLIANKEDVPFTINYYEFESEEEAQKAYQYYKKNLAEFLTTSSKNHETTGAVFAKTVATSDNEYIVISRVKNTIIFIPGIKDYKTQIDEMLEHVKY